VTVARRYRYPATVRVQQNFARIESQARRRRGRPVHPIAVELPGLHGRDKHVPVVIRPVSVRLQFDAPAGPGVACLIEEQQLDTRG
jgi:hypothetical protein